MTKIHNGSQLQISLFSSFAICFSTERWLVVLVQFLNLTGCMKNCAIRAKIALLWANQIAAK